MSTNKKAAALDPKLLGEQAENLAKESGQEISPELTSVIENLVQEKLRGGRERAGHRSKMMSVKVEPETYKRLSRARFETEKSGQEILIEGLKMWLRKNKF